MHGCMYICMHCACPYTNNTRHSNHFTSIRAPFVNRIACAASSDRKGHCTSTDWAYFSFSRISSLAVLASVRVEVCSSQWLIVSAYAYFSSFLYFYFASANIYAAPIWPPNVFHLDENNVVPSVRCVKLRVMKYVFLWVWLNPFVSVCCLLIIFIILHDVCNNRFLFR